MSEVKNYLAKIGSKGGKASKRKLTKAEAKRLAALRWGGVGGKKRRAKSRGKAPNEKIRRGDETEQTQTRKGN